MLKIWKLDQLKFLRNLDNLGADILIQRDVVVVKRSFKIDQRE